MSSHARNHVPVTRLAPGPHFQNGQHMHSQRRRFVTELSQCLFEFIIQLLPTMEELAMKEDVRRLLERLIRTIEPDSRLLSFGSTANGFSLRNSDMDLCCLIDSDEKLNASDLVTMVGDLLVRETKFHVKPLPHARIPIVKLSLDPSPGLPLGIASDIGFENRLALENTRLLLCYSMVDPTRVRTLVLFLKVWSKRRKINSPYQGTLSSYGYVLLVIYFLVHVKNPPVLPNLQQIPPLRPIPPEEYNMGDHNIWFFDDIELLRQRWQSPNTETVAELLIDFFRYYARDFSYNTGVVSIRGGLLKKDQKGWQNDNDPRFKDSRERNRFCIEDPFETDFNVARCVTKEGLFLIRGEFMRASRILQARPERAYQTLAQLCEERDESVKSPTTSHCSTYVSPRLSIPPQVPYSIGSNSRRPNGMQERDRLSPPDENVSQASISIAGTLTHDRNPPEHMAPKRTKWTSPPPDEAPDDVRTSFENRLGLGLTLATATTDAREKEKAYHSSSSNSEVLSDDGDAPSDITQDEDVKSVRSFTGEPSARPQRREGQATFSVSAPYRMSQMYPGTPIFTAYQQMNVHARDFPKPSSFSFVRGRRFGRPNNNDVGPPLPPVSYQNINAGNFRRHELNGNRPDIGLRRSNSGPVRGSSTRLSLRPDIVSALHCVAPPSSSPTRSMPSISPTVYYETNVCRTDDLCLSMSPASTSPSSLNSVNPLLQHQQQRVIAHAPEQEPEASILDGSEPDGLANHLASGLSFSEETMASRYLHSHSHSDATIVGHSSPIMSPLSLEQDQGASRESSPAENMSPLLSPTLGQNSHSLSSQDFTDMLTLQCQFNVPNSLPPVSTTTGSPRVDFQYSSPQSTCSTYPPKLPRAVKPQVRLQLNPKIHPRIPSQSQSQGPLPSTSRSTLSSPRLSPSITAYSSKSSAPYANLGHQKEAYLHALLQVQTLPLLSCERDSSTDTGQRATLDLTSPPSESPVSSVSVISGGSGIDDGLPISAAGSAIPMSSVSSASVLGSLRPRNTAQTAFSLSLQNAQQCMENIGNKEVRLNQLQTVRQWLPVRYSSLAVTQIQKAQRREQEQQHQRQQSFDSCGPGTATTNSRAMGGTKAVRVRVNLESGRVEEAEQLDETQINESKKETNVDGEEGDIE